MKYGYAKSAMFAAMALLFSAAGVAGSGDKVEATNMFGGPAYLGPPHLELTAALVRAGGGAENFSTAQALTAMLGGETVKSEVAKLAEQYGEDNVHHWLAGTDAAVASALKHATEMGITLPAAPQDLTGRKLAVALVQAGTGSDGTFWSGRFYDTLVSHDIHNIVMGEVNNNPALGYEFDKTVHMITNQAFYDVARALGHEQVKLASLH